MENPIEMDDLGGQNPIFGSTPIYDMCMHGLLLVMHMIWL